SQKRVLIDIAQGHLGVSHGSDAVVGGNAIPHVPASQMATVAGTERIHGHVSEYTRMQPRALNAVHASSARETAASSSWAFRLVMRTSCSPPAQSKLRG